MTTRPEPQCLSCARWKSPLDDPLGQQTCSAFPFGIPADILNNHADHRETFSGDLGLRWISHDGAEFPSWALAEGDR